MREALVWRGTAESQNEPKAQASLETRGRSGSRGDRSLFDKTGESDRSSVWQDRRAHGDPSSAMQGQAVRPALRVRSGWKSVVDIRRTIHTLGGSPSNR